MRKRDKILALLVIIILITASVGIYFFVLPEEKIGTAAIQDFIGVTGVIKDVPKAIVAPDSNPFYPLIATPLAVHYDAEGERKIIPLLIKNMNDPSTAVIRISEKLKILGNEKILNESKSAKDVSLEVALEHWKSSEAALIIENNQSGYELGVLATPLASYLSIPVIVTDKIDTDVKNVLRKIGVEKTLICGENIEGYGDVLKFNDVDEIVDTMIKFLRKRFKPKNPQYEINYLTITNPIDAWPPKVLDSKRYNFGPESNDWSFTIPKDYMYALVRIEADTEEPVSFSIGADLEDLHPVLQREELTEGRFAMAKRDENGNIIGYRFFIESVAYGRGGVTYNIYGSTDVSATVTVEKLQHPVYPMMKSLSTLAPYLTAYHQGLVFGKPDFAFTANDTIRKENGEKIPGFYMPRFNADLTTISNKHVYNKIHKPLNDVLAKIADVSPNDLDSLHEYYDDEEKKFHIALVGGATVIPQYYYQNILEPFGDINRDGVDDTAYAHGGGGTPSDVIYGNIDPVKYDWSPKAQDIYSALPDMENAVGRITGWDAQDASALILRSIFYDEIIANIRSDWKNNFAVLIGDGLDHQKPWFRYKLEEWFGVFSFIKSILEKIPLLEIYARFLDPDGPWKGETGAGEIFGLRIKEKVGEAMGFNVNFALKSHAMIEGYTEEELDQVKKSNILYRLLFKKKEVRDLVGEDVVKGGEYMEQSNYIFTSGHGTIELYGLDGPDLVVSGFDIILIPGKWLKWITRRLSPISGGWIGPGRILAKEYTPISVPGLDMGPSFMFLDSCVTGKIDGIYPQQNIGQALLHAGVGCLVTATTGSLIPGGYLPGKDKMTDTPFSVWKLRKEWEKKIEEGEYPPLHYGNKLFEDMCNYMKLKDCSVGEALRHAKNRYLKEDLSWKLWWTPPLGSSVEVPDVYGPHEETKYITYFEFTLYGDPAFNPYEPVNEGAM